MSLDGIATASGGFRVLAIDHRDSMRAFLAPDDPDAVSPRAITDLKLDLVRELAPLATGVMLEPEYSIPQVSDAGVLPERVGFLAALEAQGYLGDPGAAPARLADGWSVAAAKASGAAAAKLLVSYHPDAALAAEQEAVATDLLAQCRAVDLPLVLEPLFYDLESPTDRPRVVLETARRFAAIGPDLLKLPFPVDTVLVADRDGWTEQCLAITASCPMPWALLSGGGSFDEFAAQLDVAMDSGCSGFMVGRALWGEAALAPVEQRIAVIRDLVVPRLAALATRVA